MVRKEVDTFGNANPWWDSEDKRWHQVKIIVGVDTNPPEPARNAMLYFRIVEKSAKRKDGKFKTDYSGKRLFLTHSQFVRMSMLMTLSRHFWAKTYIKGKPNTKKTVLNFRKTWKEFATNFEAL
jgi:hypothetical protein